MKVTMLRRHGSPNGNAQNQMVNPTDIVPANIDETAVSDKSGARHNHRRPTWIQRHKTGLHIAGFALAGAVTLLRPHAIPQEVEDIGQHLAVAGEIVAATESAAWLGAGMMVASAGSKIGNPLTLKSRLKDLRDELGDNRLYRAGWAVGAAGAIGTSTLITVGAISTLPPNSWPLALTASAVSLEFSTIPFRPQRHNDQPPQPNAGDQS